MNWLFISFIANVILGVSAIFDKMLLRRRVANPLLYTFWVAVSGGAALALIPFGSAAISLHTFFLAVLTGVTWFFAAYFFFRAIAKGEASVALPLIGALAPVATVIVSIPFLSDTVGAEEYVGFFILVFGGLLFLRAEEPRIRMRVFAAALLSAIFFGISNVLLKVVFEESSFVAGLVWTRVAGAAVALGFLGVGKFRKKIFTESHGVTRSGWIWYFGNRVLAAGGTFLGFFAIFLAHPAIVDAANGLKYAVVFFGGWLLLNERFRGKVLVLKFFATFLIIAGLAWFALGEYAASIPVNQGRHISWGITFSQKFSRELGLDWQKNFEAILAELQPKKVRLIAYWDEIEKVSGVYDFSDLDWLLLQSQRAGVEVILAVGMKVPRWPECHIPNWIVREFPVSNSQFPDEAEEYLLRYMRVVVERYKDNSSIKMWQVENEPYLLFGKCPERPDGFLQREIGIVRSVDPSHKILVTDGGEFGDWYRSAKAGDVFGTTMYRRVYPRFIGPLFGPMEYPISPSYFRFKEKIIRWLTGDYNKKFMVVELQAEPWGKIELPFLPLEEQIQLFSPDYFSDTIRYARETGFSEYYLWGAEWWYWLREKQNDSRMWDEVKTIITLDKTF